MSLNKLTPCQNMGLWEFLSRSIRADNRNLSHNVNITHSVIKLNSPPILVFYACLFLMFDVKTKKRKQD